MLRACLAFAGLQLAFAAQSSFGASLGTYLEELTPDEAFPGATVIEAPHGDPPIAAVHDAEGLLGHLFLNTDFVSAVGYSGRPIHVLVGLGTDAIIRSAWIVEHHEPIVLIGIPESNVNAVLENYVGVDVGALAGRGLRDRSVDVLSGATVTVMVIDDSVLRSAIKAARQLGLGGLKPVRQTQESGPRRVVDTEQMAIEDWIALIGDGSVRRLKLTVGDVNQAFADSDDPAAAKRPEKGPPEETFIELFAALVSVPTIGVSVLGEREYRNLEKRIKPAQQALLLAGRGSYSFKGSGYVRGGIFDRFQVLQGDNSIRFRDRHHKRLRRVAAAGAPEFKEVDLFRIPEDSAFDPAMPWNLELLVSRETGPTSKAFVTFGLEYATPDKYLLEEPGTDPVTALTGTADEEASVDALLGGASNEGLVEDLLPPLWQQLWRDKRWQIAALCLALAVVTLIFFSQNWVVKFPRLSQGLRIGILLFTLFGIGFYANAQLSVINILTVVNALLTGFDWGYFLMEPLIFILWGAVAAGLLFWGRGAYCGWLCPFGALQELMNRLARALKVPQLRLPWGLHERLWSLKYIIFLILFGVSLHSLALAERLAEVEPFKTAIILKFVRDWPFLLFVAAMLLPGLFIERFYCRYFCALGAALAIPARLRTFEWLKRYKQCGTPCQVCAKGCMVQAIHPEGHINPNECLYCLHCQELYYDDQRCPVVVQQRQRRERAAARFSEDKGQHIDTLLGDIKQSRDGPER